MSLPDATQLAHQLHHALAGQLALARGERALYRRLDAAGLMERLAERERFRAHVAGLEAQLAESLSACAKAWGLAEVTVDALCARAPEEGEHFARALADVRAAAAALAEEERLNRQLVGRTLACVRGLVNALTLQPTAYNRRGALPTAPAPHGTVSTRV